MFRSGSTMIARMLDVHPQVASASDPMRPLFNSLRYDLASENYRSAHSRFDPLGDYFLQDCDLMQLVLGASLDIRAGMPASELITAVVKRAEMFSGAYAEALDAEKSLSTYKEFVQYFLDTVANVYGQDKDYKCVAFKEVWSTEFYPALKRAFPPMKCIAIVRDPRAVVASKNATGEPYPYIFMGRQWRKLACLAAYLDHSFEDFLLLCYEDIVQKPEEHVARICSFLDVEYNEDLLDLSLYKDGRGNPWKQNTSYKDIKSRRINAGSVDKWKKTLDTQDILSIEVFTHDWMRYFGYKPENSVSDINSLNIDHYKRLDHKNLAKWIRPFAFDSDKERLANELVIEKLRLAQGMNLNAEEKMRLHLKWW
ncbi:MAG: sulfotransferase [Desulfatiglandaceae bacterium]